ncbi:MAG: DUF4838 domain-containing protein [Clostridia bacterium]|nr:DUF4838 domain-containing protein [Clostridia bacterium]
MKKLLCLVLAVLTLASAATLPVGAFISEAEYTEMLGDADGSGQVNAKDVFAVKRSIVGFGGEISVVSADANGDGAVNERDILLMKAYFAGIVSSLYGDSTAPVKRLILGGYNAEDFVITYADGESENVRFAAEELQKYLKAALGYENPIELNSSAEHKFVLRTDEELGVEGIDILVSDGNVYLTGGTLRGCMYAVYDFLERYVGWVFINFENEYINENQSVSAPEGSHYRHIPTIWDRDSQTWSYQNNNKIEHIESALKLKISSWKNRGVLEKSEKYGYSVGYVGGAHMMSTYAPTFVRDNSSYTDWCNQELYDECKENVLAKIESVLSRGYNCDRLTVAPMDNDKYCKCRFCNKHYKASGSLMGSQLRFINRLAEEVAEIYPGVHIMTTAYWAARVPPSDIVPNENVDILFCWGGCTNHPYDGSECFEEGNWMWYTNIKEHTYFEKWAEITSGAFYVWIYATSYAGFLAEPAMFNHMRQDIKYLVDHNVDGVYCEGYYGTSDTFKDGNCFDLLTMYMFIRLQWDPYMTEEEYNSYIDEFLRYYYGDGWEYIRRYIEMNEEATDAVNACAANNCDLMFAQMSIEYFNEHAEEMFELADNAVALAKTESEIDHTEHIAASIYWLCLSATSEDLEGTEQEQAKYAERYARLYNWVLKYPIKNLDDSWEKFNPTDPTVKDPYEWNAFVTSTSKPYKNIRKIKDPIPTF